MAVHSSLHKKSLYVQVFPVVNKHRPAANVHKATFNVQKAAINVRKLLFICSGC